MAHVVVRDRTGKVLQKVTLERAIVIGRSAECDVRVPDTRVSREHCELVPADDGGWVLRDRASRNGTYVNGKPVREHHLRDGDVVEVGANRIGFFAGSARRARAADPVLAGLVDAESLAGRGPGTWESPELSSTGSSLYATRVMVVMSDESTVAGVQEIAPSPSLVESRAAAPNDRIYGCGSVKSSGKKWGTLIGALGLMAGSLVILLYWS